MTIAFLGLGSMGVGMAGNLVGAGRDLGHDVVVWNRSPGRVDPLLAAGATLARSPKEAASDAGVVFTMLADDAALAAVMTGEDGLVAGMAGGTLHVGLSTVSVAAADRAAAVHAAHGQRYLSAPVFGRPAAAAAAKLFVAAAGAPADLDEAQPWFERMGQRVFRIGNTPSQANLVKLCGNFTILAAVEAMAEGMALAEKGGVPKAKLHEVLVNTLFGAPIYQNYGRIIVEDAYEPAGFKAPLGLKDMRLAGEAAEALRVPMPLLSLLRTQLVQTIAVEGDEIDWSGIGRTVARNAGL